MRQNDGDLGEIGFYLALNLLTLEHRISNSIKDVVKLGLGDT